MGKQPEIDEKLYMLRNENSETEVNRETEGNREIPKTEGNREIPKREPRGDRKMHITHNCM